MKLCCLVNPHYVCLHCGDTLCYTCGKKYGVAHHFIINQCRKRYTKEQQVKWGGGAPKTSSPWRRFRQAKLDRTLYRPETLDGYVGYEGSGGTIATYAWIDSSPERVWLALPPRTS